MPKPKKGPHFGGSAAHHAHLMGNLTTELFRHGRVQTTHAKAKRVQPLAERMVTFAKRGDLHARRQVHRVIQDRDVVHKLFEDVGPAFAGRDGGYTRVLKTGSRKGDHAPMALIELVEASRGQDGTLTEAPRRRWSLRRRRGTVSQSAQEREEQEAAAEDRGEGPVAGDDEALDLQPGAAAEPDPTGLDPAEIEQRLAQAEEADEADEAGSQAAETGEGGEDVASHEDDDTGRGGHGTS